MLFFAVPTLVYKKLLNIKYFRLELTTGSPLGEIPERDYMVLEPTLKVRALSETHLADSPVTNEVR